MCSAMSLERDHTPSETICDERKWFDSYHNLDTGSVEEVK